MWSQRKTKSIPIVCCCPESHALHTHAEPTNWSQSVTFALVNPHHRPAATASSQTGSRWDSFDEGLHVVTPSPSTAPFLLHVSLCHPHSRISALWMCNIDAGVYWVYCKLNCVFLYKKLKKQTLRASGANVVINYRSNYHNLHRYTPGWKSHPYSHTKHTHIHPFRPKPRTNSTLDCEDAHLPWPPFLADKLVTHTSLSVLSSPLRLFVEWGQWIVNKFLI